MPEMQKIPGLAQAPAFSPIVSDFYSGMVVTVPLFANLLLKKLSPKELWLRLEEYYAGQKLVTMAPFGTPEDGFLAANHLARQRQDGDYSGRHGERLLLAARFDNLGKGASGAAVQCLNLMTGQEETAGLIL